jgi:hypothetical protein
VGRTAVVKTISRAAVVVALALPAVGCSSDEGEDAGGAVTANTETATTTAETTAIPAGPTPENVRIAIFERAYSECASTKFALLANKYKVAKKTKPRVATAVAVAWTKYFKGGKDAIREGRAGCRLAFDEEQ